MEPKETEGLSHRLLTRELSVLPSDLHLLIVGSGSTKSLDPVESSKEDLLDSVLLLSSFPNLVLNFGGLSLVVGERGPGFCCVSVYTMLLNVLELNCDLYRNVCVHRFQKRTLREPLRLVSKHDTPIVPKYGSLCRRYSQNILIPIYDASQVVSKF